MKMNVFVCTKKATMFKGQAKNIPFIKASVKLGNLYPPDWLVSLLDQKLTALRRFTQDSPILSQFKCLVQTEALMPGPRNMLPA